MIVSIDSVASHSKIRIGGEVYIKVSPMICAHIETGELLYDARLIPEYKNSKPPMVEYIGNQR